jgi:CHAT domain-containing protein/tetratricopeptide (TPR) repeat protein
MSVEDDIKEVFQLQKLKWHDPSMACTIISKYKEILHRLDEMENQDFLKGITLTCLADEFSELPIGDLPTNIFTAIKFYDEALKFISPDIDPLNYATIMNNQGLAYSNALLLGDRTANLKNAIRCFDEALKFRKPEVTPLEYARTMDSRGTAYIDLPTGGDRIENLELAIHCFEEAIKIWFQENATFDYAMTLHNLGLAYSNLPTGDLTENLKEAIRCYDKSLKIITPETEPSKYALIMNNRGVAFDQFLIGDLDENRLNAIQCYDEALRFRKPEKSPLDYAMTIENKGIALAGLRIGDRDKNLFDAISCFLLGLKFYSAKKTPSEYARIMGNLGNAYSDLQEVPNTNNIKIAIEYFDEALKYYTPENAPFEYANMMNSRGLAYLEIPTGDRSLDLTEAIRCFDEALKIFTPDKFPIKYGETMFKRGLAFSKVPTENRFSDTAGAIRCYNESLKFLTLETAPSGNRDAYRSLAEIFFSQENWEAADAMYYFAIQAGEILFQSGHREESKASEIANNNLFYRNAAFTIARLGDPNRAFLTLEQGKTRVLSETLKIRIPRQKGIPDDVWSNFQKAGANFRLSQIAARQDSFFSTNKKIDYSLLSTICYRYLEIAIKDVRRYKPTFLKKPEFSDYRVLLTDDHIAIVSFAITEQGSFAFVMKKDTDGIILVELPFTHSKLVKLLNEKDAQNKFVDGWLVMYQRYRENLLRRGTANISDEEIKNSRKSWMATMNQVLIELGKDLIGPVIATLPPAIDHIIFLPAGELFLLPLHAALLDENTRVCDHYTVSYAPSADILLDIETYIPNSKEVNLYLVVNPGKKQGDLPFSYCEGISIVDIFKDSLVPEPEECTKKNVISGMPGREYLHFSCHGEYNWYNPLGSGLSLSDYPLILDDLIRGNLDLSSSRLVTLSACETGIVDVIRGSPEEYSGLPSGFIVAGVPCVIGSLWTVTDISTAILIENFYYNHIKENMNIPDALRAAQDHVRKMYAGDVADYIRKCCQKSMKKLDEGRRHEMERHISFYKKIAQNHPEKKPFEHPYYWAAFQVIGK